VLKAFLLFASLCLWGFTVQAAEVLTIAVASSLYPTMQLQATAFEKQYGVTVKLVSGSTGRLYNQIMQGAPFDVFIAADAQRPNLLSEKGKSIAQHEVGLGYLGVMLAKPLETVSPKNIKHLTLDSVRHIAIANPEVAPFGQMSKRILQAQGLWETLKPKFVYTQNALQAAMMVEKGLVDAAFVPVSTDAASIATIAYQGVLLADKPMARLWLASISTQQETPIMKVTLLKR